MGMRKFPLRGEAVAGGHHRSLHHITCSSCGTVAHVTAAPSGAPMGPEIICRQFRNKGWEVGKNDRSDLCPECVTRNRKSRAVSRIRAVESVSAPKPVQEVPPVVTTVTPLIQPEPAAPRMMSREDRRLIFAKLQDVYLDERRGYDAGWTDQKVASDLGVPRAWVSEIREQNFGSVRVDEGAIEALSQARKLLDEITGAITDFREIEKRVHVQIAELQSRGETLSRQLALIDKALR